MIPLKDENSTLSTPILSYAIIGICIVVFLIQISSSGYDNGHLFYSYGVVPTSLLGIEPLPNDLNKIDRYWVKKYIIKGKKYLICSEWYENPNNNDKTHFLNWYRKIVKTIPSNEIQ